MEHAKRTGCKARLSRRQTALLLFTLSVIVPGSAAAQFSILEDFESYADTAALAAAWADRTSTPTQSLDTSFAYNGPNSMRIDYDVSDSPFADAVEIDFGSDQDFSLKTTFRILFTQGGANSAEDIVLELRSSSDALLGSATFSGATTELFAVREVSLVSGFTNLAQVRKVVLAIVDGGDNTGSGTVYFDDLSVSSGTYSTCRTCHGEFRDPYVALTDGETWLPDLHDQHRYVMLGADVAMTDECKTCHTSPDRFPVFLDSSDGGTGLPAISCMGCHGRDEDMGHDGTVSPGRGAGLRQHHTNAGVTACAKCHPDADPNNYKPVGENVAPPYYFVPDAVHPDKPVDACSVSELVVSLANGLDNDGDLLYELADPDCRPVRPAVPVVGPFGMFVVVGLLLAVATSRLRRQQGE